jgi:hypothetical protein
MLKLNEIKNVIQWKMYLDISYKKIFLIFRNHAINPEQMMLLTTDQTRLVITFNN